MVNEIEQSVIRVFYAASNALWPGTYDERIIFILDTLTYLAWYTYDERIIYILDTLT